MSKRKRNEVVYSQSDFEDDSDNSDLVTVTTVENRNTEDDTEYSGDSDDSDQVHWKGKVKGNQYTQKKDKNMKDPSSSLDVNMGLKVSIFQFFIALSSVLSIIQGCSTDFFKLHLNKFCHTPSKHSCSPQSQVFRKHLENVKCIL